MSERREYEDIQAQTHSPSLPPGFSAAAAKQRGQDAVKSTLCCGTPLLKRTEGSLLVKFSCSFSCRLPAAKK